MRRGGWRVRGGICLLFAAALALSGCDRGEQPGQLGRVAPMITVNDGQRSLDLRALHGQVVLLNFWASWCAPCLAEMPSLEALHEQVPEVKLVGIAFDEDAATYNAYLARRPLPFLSVLDAKGTAHASFGTFRPPETYVIDKKGIIRRKFIGAQNWTSPEIVAMLHTLVQS